MHTNLLLFKSGIGFLQKIGLYYFYNNKKYDVVLEKYMQDKDDSENIYTFNGLIFKLSIKKHVFRYKDYTDLLNIEYCMEIKNIGNNNVIMPMMNDKIDIRQPLKIRFFRPRRFICLLLCRSGAISQE